MSSQGSEPSLDAPLSAREAGELFQPLLEERHLLVAVSGGPDSVALLALLAEWAGGDGRPSLSAATVDHGLRAASAGEAVMVAELCGRLGIPHALLRWAGDKPASGLQARAREARYGLLSDEANRLGGAVLVTAHHQDDQAETMLMRLANGSGPAGLVGMRARIDRSGLAIARPLLDIPKARLIATVRERGLPFVTDPSNADERYERSRWRGLMPVLAEQGLTAGRLALLARRLERAEEALARRAGTVLEESLLPVKGEGEIRLDFAGLLREPREIVLRVVGLALERLQPGPLSAMRLERLEACVEAFRQAAEGGARLRRTLAGCVLTLSPGGVLGMRREGQRRRGVHPDLP